jgi:hypothetical protein
MMASEILAAVKSALNGCPKAEAFPCDLTAPKVQANW